MVSNPDGGRVRKLFCEAMDQPADQRKAFIDRACAGDSALAAEVRSLLEAYTRAGEYLGSPTLDAQEVGSSSPTASASAGGEQSPGSLVGKVLGPYKLMELIGEGGFGVVYVAEQSHPIRRRVAVKLIKAGMDTRQVIARFEAERQALAMMDHPNIARVLDAGTTDVDQGSLPYFVMELVRGVPITTYCDQARLSAAQRLELLVPVCQAVQHAHTKGIIHRDIKPSNVMVTLHDGRPVPKVIDFGIAKAISGRLTDSTVYTELRQMIGTPAYMSPEQAEMSGLDIDTRADVYSLGILLYELLTGGPPFGPRMLREAAMGEMQRIIREVDPPKPSTRVSTLGRDMLTVATLRGTDPQRLRRELRGDLDSIVMKALEKDRERRYGSAGSLAADVLRHLNGEPLEAGPPGAVYRTSKFIRRHRAAAGVAATIVLTMAAGTIAATAGFLRARDESAAKELARQEAMSALATAQQARQRESAALERSQSQAARAESLLRFSDLMIGSSDPNITRDARTTTRDMLDRAGAEVGRYFSGQPAEELAMRSRIGRAYAALGEYPLAEMQLRRASELSRSVEMAPEDRFALEFFLTFSNWMRMDPVGNVTVADAHRTAAAMLSARDPALASMVRQLNDVFGFRGSRYERPGGDTAFHAAVDTIRATIPQQDPLRWQAVSLLFFHAYFIADSRLQSGRTLQFEAAAEYLRTLETLALESWPATHTNIFLIRQALIDLYIRAEQYSRAREAALGWKESLASMLPAEHWLVQYAAGLAGAALVTEGDIQSGQALLARGASAALEQCGPGSTPARTMLSPLLALLEQEHGRIAADDEMRDHLADSVAQIDIAPATADILCMLRTDQESMYRAVTALEAGWAKPAEGGEELVDAFMAARAELSLPGTPRDRALAKWLTRSVWRWSGLGGRPLDQRYRLICLAEEILRGYAERDPSGFGWALCWRSILARNCGDLEEAVECAEQCRRIWDMNKGAAGATLATALLAQGKTRQALDASEEAFDWLVLYFGHDHTDTRFALSTWFDVAAQTGHADAPRARVLEYLREAADSQGINAIAFATYALMISRSPGLPSEQYDLAAKVAARALGREPRNDFVLTSAGLAHLRRGENEAARAVLEEAAAIQRSRNTRSAMTLAGLALAGAQSDSGEHAHALLDQARAHLAEDPDRWAEALVNEAQAAVDSREKAIRER